MLLDRSSNDGERLNQMFRQVLSRIPQQDERRLLLDLLRRQKARFLSDGTAAAKLIAIGESEQGARFDPVTLAAWTVVAQAILNLDETITRR